MTKCRPIVVLCPRFDENSGGCIVLHTLVDRLRKLGVEAYALPMIESFSKRQAGLKSALERLYNRVRLGPKGRWFPTHSSMDVATAPREVLDEGILVYPEVVPGNPLGARRVVRWLLFHHDLDINQGQTNEEFFYYQEAFWDGSGDAPADRKLQIRWLREDLYKTVNFEERSGACYMVRKGDGSGLRALSAEESPEILDGKSHEEIARAFNRTKTFYCEDPYTLYLYYAALCGCTPVVVPQKGLSSQQWRAAFELKQGVAYGTEEIPWAKETRDGLIADMAQNVEAENEMLLGFIARLSKAFPPGQ